MANTSSLSPLGALQQRFAIIDLGGEIRVVDRTHIQEMLSGTMFRELAFYKRHDAEILMRRIIEGLPTQSNVRQVIADFWSSPATVMYDKTAFSPLKTPASTLNFWVGPVKSVKPGRWVILRDYLRDIICAGDAATFDFLIQFMAHMVQRPEEKPGVMLVLLGRQGTGKGMYFRLLKSIWPLTTLSVSDIDQITGRFNACMERSFNICMDEALFAGDRRSMDRLKSMVTEPTIGIEQKFQPSRSIDSVHRFFAASNHSHFGNIEMDDRRFVVLQVSDAKQQDTGYFSSIMAAIEDRATIGALVYYLRRRNLATFDVRKKPNTMAHLNQRLKSLDGFDRFWYEVLQTGHLNGTGKEVFNSDDEWFVARFIPSAVLVDRYKEFNRSAQKYQTVQTSEVTASVQRLCPSASTYRQIYKAPELASAGQRRGLKLPDLATARADFERVIGGKVPWE